MELRALEIIFALLRPRGFLRRVAVLFTIIAGFVAWWARAVNIAPAMRARREKSRAEIKAEVQRRLGVRAATYVTDTEASRDLTRA